MGPIKLFYFIAQDKLQELYLILSCSLAEFVAGEADADDLYNAVCHVLDNWPTKGGDAQGNMRTPLESEPEEED